ncbi:MAG: hypothetical protein ACI843_002384 [Psychrobacter glaciei]|jgi:hypothetical protein
MITYFYWLCVVLLIVAAIYVAGVKIKNWKFATITALSIFITGSLAYFFHFQQVFVKNWGGVMTVSVPDGQYHMMATWKDDNLWIENYDPKTNTCHFREYSKGAVLEGKVLIKNCNPITLK